MRIVIVHERARRILSLCRWFAKGGVMETNLAKSIYRRLGYVVQFVTLIALLAACGGGGGGSEPSQVVTSVAVTSANPAPIEGDTVQLAAVARDQSGNVVTGTTATWSSSDTRIAAITSTGLLHAQAPGTVTVAAMIGSVSGSLTLTIAPRSAASVTITSPTANPKEGDELQLTAVVRDQNGDVMPSAAVTWSSSNTEIAAVSATGLVNTFATGNVEVTANANGTFGTLRLTITPITVSVTIGAKEVVFAYTTDRCSDLDLPDQPARFVRAEDGTLVLFDGDAPNNYVSRGTDFGSLKRDCSQGVLVSANSSTPNSYQNQEWLWSAYRLGNRWHALIHNEFHDPIASTCKPGDPYPSNPCWYNSITYAVSTDNARLFSRPTAPANVVAPAPNVWAPPFQQASYYYTEGYYNPTNIVRGNDAYYYSLSMMIPAANASQRLCVFRTATLDDPSSWRAWDGSGFTLRMTSPYVTGSPAPLCAAVLPYGVIGNLTYNTYLNRYVLAGAGAGAFVVDGRPVCGFFFWLSSDLIHWSEPQLLAEARISWCDNNPQGPGLLEPVYVAYASIIDHADTTINFESATRTPHLYYTRLNDGGLDRDLVRVPVSLTRQD
jgi:hypothetical protein